jgi:hypothetical protein
LGGQSNRSHIYDLRWLHNLFKVDRIGNKGIKGLNYRNDAERETEAFGLGWSHEILHEYDHV